ncbi:lipoprotein [Streptomyces sviceus]|uniref:lipoprotein n=1 Tax=Streptomyces sviceus TaxID=285530 RepID=UPI0036ACADE3
MACDGPCGVAETSGRDRTAASSGGTIGAAGPAARHDARTVLEAFVAAEDGVSKEQYSAFTSGGLSGTKVDYLYASELLDETKKESAFAVTTADGPVVVHLGGLDTDEHEEMLPAYELARRTLRVA